MSRAEHFCEKVARAQPTIPVRRLAKITGVRVAVARAILERVRDEREAAGR